MALGRTVAELEETLSSDELTQWIAFYNMEPFGSERDNIHAGIIASTLANIHGGSKKTWSAKDFMVIDPITRRTQSTTQFVAGLKALAKPKPKSEADDGKYR